jgi:membrane protease YdiL (CAAX protease family)
MMGLSFILLGAAVCAVWLPAVRVGRARSLPLWVPLYVVAAAIALWSGALMWRGAAGLAVFCGVGWVSLRGERRALRVAATAVVGVMAVGIGMRLYSGFPTIVFLDGIRLSPDAAPMRLTAHFGAGAVGLCLLAWYAPRLRSCRQLVAVLGPTALAAAATTTVVLTLGVAIGHVRPDLKLPWFAFWHLAKMLLFTCVLEEAFFRGLVQERLHQALAGRPAWRWLPLAATSVLFGLVHAPGGLAMIGLATVAGLGYGAAYAATRRIEPAIAVHFLVNAVHFLCFTYPRLEG